MIVVKTIADVIQVLKDFKIKVPVELKHVVPSTIVNIKSLPTDIALLIKSMWMWDIRGIGPAKAIELTRRGMTQSNIKKFMSELPTQAQVWIKTKPLPKIPRKVVPNVIQELLHGLSSSNYMITGSYRRGKELPGDIDVVYFGSADNLLKVLASHGKKWYAYAKGPAKIAGIFTTKFLTRPVEVDLYLTSKKSKHAAILYSTGSMTFNIIMRAKAKSKGYKLNQYGLFDKNDSEVPTKSESDIFKKLGMEYKEPPQRSI